MDGERVYLTMHKYVDTVLKIASKYPSPINSRSACKTPIAQPIDPDSPALPSHLVRHFMTLVGVIGWLVNTGRPDLAYAHSRISQHMASPTISHIA